MIRKLIVVSALLALIAPTALAGDRVRNKYVPTTISPEAQQAYDEMIKFFKRHLEI